MASVYVETTIPSYLTSRPSRDLIIAAHQQVTHDWWGTAAQRFELVISDAVLAEAGDGDPEMARRRLQLLAGLRVLETTNQVIELSETYRRRLSIPESAGTDALHIAFCVVNKIDFMATWNCTHLANINTLNRLRAMNHELQLPTPIIVTPDQF